jgi:hypothetical protein
MPSVAQPSLRFFHSKALRKRTLEVLDAVEGDDDPTRHAAALTEVVTELTEAGFGYYLLKPLEMADSSFVVRQSASFGVGACLRVMTPIFRTVLGGMDGKQLVVVSGFIRSLMK